MESLKIQFICSSSGRSYFQEFLNQIPKSDRAQLLAFFKDIHLHGFKAIGCSFRHIENKLWEIKARTTGGSWRFFYVMTAPDTMYVLHSYKKQGQKAPLKELNVARKRLTRILEWKNTKASR